jgi:hypothetical protein
VKGGAHVTETEGAEAELRHGAVVPAKATRHRVRVMNCEKREGESGVEWCGRGRGKVKGQTTRKLQL